MYPVFSTSKNLNTPLSCEAEVNETYVGGKEAINIKTNVQGDKVPMLGMIQKDGDIKLKQFEKVNNSNIRPIIDEHISENAIVHMDESPL